MGGWRVRSAKSAASVFLYRCGCFAAYPTKKEVAVTENKDRAAIRQSAYKCAPAQGGEQNKRKRRKNLNPAKNMDVDAWRERKVRELLSETVQANNARFALEHADDSDEELLEHVRQAAAELGRMPHPLELPGGVYLKRRFGDWDRLAERIGCRHVSAKAGTRAYGELLAQAEKDFAAQRKQKKAEKAERRRKDHHMKTHGGSKPKGK